MVPIRAVHFEAIAVLKRAHFFLISFTGWAKVAQQYMPSE
jgi:hypothetical protein